VFGELKRQKFRLYVSNRQSSLPIHPCSSLPGSLPRPEIIFAICNPICVFFLCAAAAPVGRQSYKMPLICVICVARVSPKLHHKARPTLSVACRIARLLGTYRFSYPASVRGPKRAEGRDRYLDSARTVLALAGNLFTTQAHWNHISSPGYLLISINHPLIRCFYKSSKTSTYLSCKRSIHSVANCWKFHTLSSSERSLKIGWFDKPDPVT